MEWLLDMGHTVWFRSPAGFVPPAILLLATLADRRTRGSWHWILRLVGAGLMLLGQAGHLLLAYQVRHVETGLSPLAFVMVSTSVGPLLLALGYFGLIFSKRVASAGEAAAPNDAAPTPLLAFGTMLGIALVIAVPVLFELWQRAYFECSMFPHATLLGLCVSLPVPAFVLAASLLWRIRAPQGYRIALITLLGVLAVTTVFASLPMWFMTHMAP